MDFLEEQNTFRFKSLEFNGLGSHLWGDVCGRYMRQVQGEEPEGKAEVTEAAFAVLTNLKFGNRWKAEQRERTAKEVVRISDKT